jgi:signal transduction histidine kinase
MLLSQEVAEPTIFTKTLLKETLRFMKEPAFAKAQNFYIAQEWDSTLVYTSKQLNLPNTEKELADFCHFYRGQAFIDKQMFKEAAKEFDLLPKDFIFHGQVKMYLGGIALEFSQFQKALDFFQEVDSFSAQELLGIDKNYIEENIGICYLHLEKFDEAEPYLLKSIQYQEEKKDTLQLIGSYGNLANSYYEAYRDAEAIVYFTKAYDLSKKIKDFNSKIITAANMAAVEKNRKDFNKALIYQIEYGQWKDSLNNQANIYKVAQLEKEFAVKQKQKEVSLLQAENKIKVAERNSLLYSAIVLLALLGTGFYFYKEKVKSTKIIVAQKEDLDRLNATKDKLFSIVSHDLRSSVNALKTSNANLIATVASKDTEKLDSLLHANSGIVNGAYNLLDNLLNWALLQTKQSYFEISQQKLFFTIEHVAYNYQGLMQEKNIEFENTVSKSINVYADQESLKIIVRNLLDNAIKFSKPQDAIKIYTQTGHEGFCDLIIEDTGIGMQESTRLELLKESALLSKKENENIIGTGLGMQLCRSMIKKNKGTFSIESELGKGTKMIVSLSQIPLNG